MSDPLSQVLGAAPPASVAALPEEVRARLAEQVVAARREQVRQGEAAVDRALRGVPLPVRGIVRRALT